jgi:hypothetical protein
MNKKWMLITAGILDIIYGALGVLLGIYTSIFASLLSELIRSEYWSHIIGPMALIAGILSIIGGIYVVKIKHWSLAIIGSICTLFITWGGFIFFVNTPVALKGLAWIPAIVAIILTILSKSQFEK